MESLLRQYFSDNNSVYIASDHADINFHTGVAVQVNGDFVKLYLNLKEDRIIEAKYNVSGCPFMIAITAFYIERIKNKTLLEAAEIQDFNIEKTKLKNLLNEQNENKNEEIFKIEKSLVFIKIDIVI